MRGLTLWQRWIADRFSGDANAVQPRPLMGDVPPEELIDLDREAKVVPDLAGQRKASPWEKPRPPWVLKDAAVLPDLVYCMHREHGVGVVAEVRKRA